MVATSRVESENGYIKLKMKLAKNEVSLLRIAEIKDESPSYIGLDDSKITSCGGLADGG